MLPVAESVSEIMGAISQLHSAATVEGDDARKRSAEHLGARLEGITTAEDLRDAVRDGLRFYGGGMGSFQDADTSPVAAAIARLGESLRRAI